MNDPMQRAPAGQGQGSRNQRVERHQQDSPPSLFDPVGDCGLDAGRRRRDDGVAQAETNTWTPWKVKANAELERWSREGVEGTSDDLLEAIGEPPLSSRNAVGALFQGAARRGLIANTDRYVVSRRESAHARRIAVWRGTGKAVAA